MGLGFQVLGDVGCEEGIYQGAIMRLMASAGVRWNELRLRSVVDVKVGAWHCDEESRRGGSCDIQKRCTTSNESWMDRHMPSRLYDVKWRPCSFPCFLYNPNVLYSSFNFPLHYSKNLEASNYCTS